jgi:hypothetical protein
VDRPIVIAAAIALTLATFVKFENAANIGTVETTRTQPVTFTQPDPMWLVGP